MRYTLKPEWTAAHDNGTFNIYRMMSTDPAAHAALWRYALTFDLMTKVSWFNGPIDDPIQLWLDVPATCDASDRGCPPRTRAGPAVRDRRAHLQHRVRRGRGRHRQPLPRELGPVGAWQAGPKGATCERTKDPADLALDIRLIGAAYLGDASLHEFAKAGWIEELRPGAIAASGRCLADRHRPVLPVHLLTVYPWQVGHQ